MVGGEHDGTCTDMMPTSDDQTSSSATATTFSVAVSYVSKQASVYLAALQWPDKPGNRAVTG